MSTDFIPYARHHIHPNDYEAVYAALSSGSITRGEYVRKLEEAVAELSGKKYGVAFSNGTTALYCAFAPFQPATIYTPPLTFFAVANAALLSGNQLKIVDLDGTRRYHGAFPTKVWGGSVFVPMDYAGLPHLLADKPTNVFVIRDACHSIGGKMLDGRPHTADDYAAVYSFHAVKQVTGGEGGMVVTDDLGYADEMRVFRDNGRRNGEHIVLSLNFHMSDIAAALALSQLSRLEETRKRREELVLRYYGALCEDWRIILPEIESGHAYHLFVIQLTSEAPDRDAFRESLKARGIGTQVHYVPLYRQPIISNSYPASNFPATENVYKRIVSLPLYYGLGDGDQARVIEAVKYALDGK